MRRARTHVRILRNFGATSSDDNYGKIVIYVRTAFGGKKTRAGLDEGVQRVGTPPRVFAALTFTPARSQGGGSVNARARLSKTRRGRERERSVKPPRYFRYSHVDVSLRPLEPYRETSTWKQRGLTGPYLEAAAAAIAPSKMP